VPVDDTATNLPLPNATLFQLLSAGEVLMVQLIPSALVITRFPVPVTATATNTPFPYAMLRQSLSAAEVLDDHVIPGSVELVGVSVDAEEVVPAPAAFTALIFT
jgi:hypothetical protein